MRGYDLPGQNFGESKPRSLRVFKACRMVPSKLKLETLPKIAYSRTWPETFKIGEHLFFMKRTHIVVAVTCQTGALRTVVLLRSCRAFRGCTTMRLLGGVPLYLACNQAGAHRCKVHPYISACSGAHFEVLWLAFPLLRALSGTAGQRVVFSCILRMHLQAA